MLQELLRDYNGSFYRVFFSTLNWLSHSDFICCVSSFWICVFGKLPKGSLWQFLHIFFSKLFLTIHSEIFFSHCFKSNFFRKFTKNSFKTPCTGYLRSSFMKFYKNFFKDYYQNRIELLPEILSDIIVNIYIKKFPRDFSRSSSKDCLRNLKK